MLAREILSHFLSTIHLSMSLPSTFGIVEVGRGGMGGGGAQKLDLSCTLGQITVSKFTVGVTNILFSLYFC